MELPLNQDAINRQEQSDAFPHGEKVRRTLCLEEDNVPQAARGVRSVRELELVESLQTRSVRREMEVGK